VFMENPMAARRAAEAERSAQTAAQRNKLHQVIAAQQNQQHQHSPQHQQRNPLSLASSSVNSFRGPPVDSPGMASPRSGIITTTVGGHLGPSGVVTPPNVVVAGAAPPPPVNRSVSSSAAKSLAVQPGVGGASAVLPATFRGAQFAPHGVGTGGANQVRDGHTSPASSPGTSKSMF
jgi:hypothetical protein